VPVVSVCWGGRPVVSITGRNESPGGSQGDWKADFLEWKTAEVLSDGEIDGRAEEHWDTDLLFVASCRLKADKQSLSSITIHRKAPDQRLFAICVATGKPVLTTLLHKCSDLGLGDCRADQSTVWSEVTMAMVDRLGRLRLL
jgi:hypothetical protein